MKKKSVMRLAVLASALMLLAGCALSTEHMHTLRFVAEKDSTCAEKGNIAHNKCVACGATFSADPNTNPIENVSIPVDPSAHSLIIVDAKPATLDDEGTEAHWKCSECGKLFSDEAGENETMLEEVTIPKGFAKLYSGTVTESIGDTNGPFKNASASSLVTVNAFYMALTETTYERWYEVYTWAVLNGYTFGSEGREGNDGTDGEAPTSEGKEPVTYISWRDAVIWCNAASEKDGRTPVYYLEGTSVFTSDKVLRVSESDSVSVGRGKAEKAEINEVANGYRLPTEAEWEYAARGGDPNADEWSYKYAGTDFDSDLGNYAIYKSNSGSKTAAVATKYANSAGLYDMSGNVLEWCQDINMSGSTYRVNRGGYWNYYASGATVAYRYYNYPYYQSSSIGFRVAFSAL